MQRLGVREPDVDVRAVALAPRLREAHVSFATLIPPSPERSLLMLYELVPFSSPCRLRGARQQRGGAEEAQCARVHGVEHGDGAELRRAEVEAASGRGEQRRRGT